MTKDSVTDLLKDRRAQAAAGALATAGAAAAAAKLANDRRDRGGGGEETHPSRAFRLKRREGAAEGLRRIAAGRAEKMIERLGEAQTVEDPATCIHAARKDLKKLRAVVRLLRFELGEDAYRAEDSRYREAGKLLSEGRDAEVKVETLEALLRRLAAEGGSAGAEEWLTALRAERDAAVARTQSGSATFDALALAREGRVRIEAWRLQTDSWDLVGPGLTRAYGRGRKRMRDAAAEPSGENLHRWRKRVKDLWYHLRILEKAVPGSLAGSIERADDLADALGEHHDLTVLRDDLLVRELPTVRRPALVAAMDARQAELAATAFELGERLYGRKPRAFRKRMRRGWRKWRGGDA